MTTQLIHPATLIATLIVSVSLCPTPVGGEENGWRSLFDGKTLEGWEQRNGTASYRIEEGVIVGRTNEGSPNSFLCTKELFGDFELEFDVKVANELNSGVQIRSNSRDGNGRVNGPQVEIEASGGSGSEAGYIYGEATDRGWLTPESELKPHKHFKDGEWNSYRVVARGSGIQTWINGVQIADLQDEEAFKTHPKGFIGLQVHGIGRGQGPFEVAWRNIRIRELPQ